MTSHKQSRFTAFTQRELEILELALDRIDPLGADGLPQHAQAMDLTRASLVDELRPAQTAPNSRDGSHFGVSDGAPASHVTLCLSAECRKWLIRSRWHAFCQGTREVQTVHAPRVIGGIWAYISVTRDGANDLMALAFTDGEFGPSHAFVREL